MKKQREQFSYNVKFDFFKIKFDLLTNVANQFYRKTRCKRQCKFL